MPINIEDKHIETELEKRADYGPELDHKKSKLARMILRRALKMTSKKLAEWLKEGK